MHRKDRMTSRMDTSLRRMAATMPLPPRLPGEPFRAYHRRAAELWLKRYATQHTEQAEQLRRLLARDARRHLTSETENRDHLTRRLA
jgi:hypothetical protein